MSEGKKARDMSGPQQITRVPPWRPGKWVRLKDYEPGANGDSLSGKVRRVRSLTCSVTEQQNERALWRVHFDDGRQVTADLVLRFADEQEVPRGRKP
jgi:hypothetical protein